MAELTEGTIYEPEKIRQTHNIFIDVVKEIKKNLVNGVKKYDEMLTELRKISHEHEPATREG